MHDPASSSQAVHDLGLLRRGVPGGLRAGFFDVTSASAVLSVMGPRSRELLAGLSADDLSDAAFPFGWSREIDLAGLTVRATGLTFVGELGWELHVPAEMAVAARSAVGFRGADAVRRHRAEGVTRRLASLVVTDPEAYPWGGELLLRDGEPAGFASSAAFGHTPGRAVLLGYLERRDGGMVDPRWLKEGRYQVAIGGELFDAAMTLRAPYDPERTRVLA